MRTIITKGAPKCPNHGCPLKDLGFPLKPKGTGICPESGAKFDYEIDLNEEEDEMVKDKFGNMIRQKRYKVTGED